MIWADYRHRAFISYAHADEAWARWLQRAIESYRIPKAVVASKELPFTRLQPLFRDRDDLPSAAELSATIEAALADSACLLVVCSKHAAESRWVNREIAAFRELGRADRIFCLLVDDPALSFPAALTDPGHPDREPLAADPRPDADGKTAAKQKIVAGMLGVGLDELRQRDTQRRLQRLTYIAGGAIAGLLVAIGLVAMTYLAQQESERQRAIAIEQQQRTQLEAARTITVNNFLQEILKAGDLEQGVLGQDVKLTEVLATARQAAAEQFADQPDIHAGILHTLGTSYLHRADYATATQLLQSSLDLRTAATGEFSLDTAASINELGRLYHQTGALDTAEQMFRRALRIVSALTDEEAPRLEGAVLNNLGILLRDRGSLAEAEIRFREALHIKRGLFGDIHEEITPTLNNLGLLLSDLDKPEEAQALYQQALEANRQLWGERHPLVGINLNNLGWGYLDLDATADAARSFRAAIDIKSASAGEKHPSTAISVSGLGVTLEQQGDVGSGLVLLEQALAVFEEAYPPNHWRLAYTRVLRGRMLAALNDPVTAHAQASAGLAVLTEVLGPEHRRTRKARDILAAITPPENTP